jgi:hypothetical protein
MTRGRRTEHSPVQLRRRLLPMQVGIGLQGFMLWAPVEKLFMTEIGFTAASVGVMAAAYAAVVPLLEVPSGILADRSSRSLLMILASGALAFSVVVGGLSHSVGTYVMAAMILGVYFALSSGTVDSIVYDTVVEETGTSDLYERWIGRVRMVEASALAGSAFAGGLLADLTSPRLTYFATVPFACASIVCFLRFREPRLHRVSEPTSLRAQVGLTFRVMVTDPRVRGVMLLAALAALLSQAVFEFGPLWLVELDAPAALYGPYWAALVASLGVAGFLTSRIPLENRWVAGTFGLLLAVAALPLLLSRSLALVIVAQTVLAMLVGIIGIRAGLLLHDAVASQIRAGVSSGVGTLAWVLFLPFSLIVGWVGRAAGQPAAGWFFLGAAIVIGVLLLAASFRSRPAEPAAPPMTDELACREVVELLSDHLDGVLPADTAARLTEHLAGCDGCTTYLGQLRQVIAAAGRLTPADLPELPGQPGQR